MTDVSAAADPAVGSGAWLDAFTGEGFEVRRERAWEPSETDRGGLPEALEVPVEPDHIVFALVVDQETDAVYVLPPDAGADRDRLGVARFSLTAETGDRGIVGLVAGVLLKGPGRKVINVLSGKVARAAAATWERKFRPEQVRLFSPRNANGSAPLTPADWTHLASGPSLLWLHGPFVQAHSGFAGLDRDLWQALTAKYEDRIWAYDHHTISKTPRANALDLLQLIRAFGGGTTVELDIVAHSRGGLVARELAERPRDGLVNVRSLVLAGTPNLGTPLADVKGLVAGINRFTNLLALAPDPVTDIAGAVVAVVTHVLGDVVAELPGITSMAPPAKNPSYLAELNERPPAPDVRYQLVGGAYDPDADDSRLGRAFANWVADKVLSDDANDLVVPSRSALGGGRVPDGEGTTLGGVSHAGYWRSLELTGHLREWLIGSVGAVTSPDSAPVAGLADGAAVAEPAPAVPAVETVETAAADPAPPAPAPSEPAAAEPAAAEPAAAEAMPAEPAPTPEPAPASEPMPPVAQPAAPPEPAAPEAAPAEPAPPEAAPTPAVPEPAPTPAPAATPAAAPTQATAAANPATPAIDILEVGVRHASLEHAPYPLVVGHFAGAPLSGAEARLDERLGGRITRLTLLNQYPRQLGDILLLPPMDDDTPRGALVVGLGPTGELTGTQLTAVVTRGLLRLANHHLELQLARAKPIFPAFQGDPRRLGISAVSIGTSWGGGLTVEGCVRALVAAVITANERLRRLAVQVGAATVPASELVSFDRLEIVERYADRIDVLADVLDRMASQAGQDEAADASSPVRVKFQAGPLSGEGASNANSPQENSDEVWRRVGIAAIEPPPNSDGSVAAALQLEFTSMGRLARAERLVSEIEPTVVAPILDRAIGRHSDPNVSGTLYELLIPHLLKGELNDGENLHLLVDRTTAAYPWELLSARAEDANPQVPLALRVGVLRQFRESQQLRHDIRRAASDTILVVGNPPPGPGFNPLPGAAKEASAVETLFRSSLGKGWGVTSLVWSADGERVAGPDPVVDQEPGEEILHRLLNGDWRIVHMAAHGEVTEDEATTGVVVGGQFHLTAKVFASLSVVPDLVFLNSCHIGQIPNRDLKGMNRVAATVAESLLRIGVRAVIAAGWAVNDVAAEAFARSLYSALLSGRHLGEAVFDARRQAKMAAKESLTWGAYQCYGDPGFRLIARPVSNRSRKAQTKGELRRRIQRLGTTASDQGRTADADPLATKRSLGRQISTLRVQALSMRSTGALSDLAEVYAELGRYDWAAVLYRRALRRGGQDVPLRAVEQTGNMMIRWAHGRVRNHGATYADVRNRVDEAERWLHQAEAIGTTDERLSLLGSFHKRCATMTEGEDRERHLRLAVESYAKAQRLRDKPYQRNNWVQLYQVHTLLGVESDPAWLKEFSVTATVSDAGGPDDAPMMTLSVPIDPNQGAEQDGGDLRWVRIERGDRVLTAGVVTGDLDVDLLVRTYRAAFRLRSSARERASVIDHVADLVALTPDSQPLHTALLSAFDQLTAADAQSFSRRREEEEAEG